MKKNYFLALIMLAAIMLSAGNLNIYVDDNRFLAENGLTQLEITYALPYNSLEFVQGQYGMEAEVFVDIAIKMEDRLIKSDSFTNKIIIRAAEKVFSDETYMDKITLTLPAYEFALEVDFTDVHSERSYSWKTAFEPLDAEGMTSDLELSTAILADTTSYLAKFHRQGTLYQVQPSHTFSNSQLYIYFYQELYNLFEDADGNINAAIEMKIFKNGELADSLNFFSRAPYERVNHISDRIDVSDYAEGYYEIQSEVIDRVSFLREKRNDHFLLKSGIGQAVRFFPAIEDDFLLAGYFFNANQINLWKSLTDEGKLNFLGKFWQAFDPNPATSENEYVSQVQERIRYANDNFSHFKPGWTSDMGRIYIKYGQPYEISKLNTNLGENDYSTYDEYGTTERQTANYFNKYTIKNYQIWKYRMKKNANYIFFDMMGSGEYKLIYSSDDEDGENSLPDWQKYLGYDFDERLLD